MKFIKCVMEVWPLRLLVELMAVYRRLKSALKNLVDQHSYLASRPTDSATASSSANLGRL